MTPHNLHPNHSRAPDTPLDQIEQELLALTTAALDEFDRPPMLCVDEFAPEFLIFPGKPPE